MFFSLLKVNESFIHLLPVWRRPGRQTQVRKPGRGITRLAQAKRGKLGIPWLKRLACARGGSPLAGGEWWGEKGALRGNLPVEGGSGKQLAGWSEGEGFPLLNVVRFKCLTRVNPINGDIIKKKSPVTLLARECPRKLTFYPDWCFLSLAGFAPNGGLQEKPPTRKFFSGRGESGL